MKRLRSARTRTPTRQFVRAEQEKHTRVGSRRYACACGVGDACAWRAWVARMYVCHDIHARIDEPYEPSTTAWRRGATRSGVATPSSGGADRGERMCESTSTSMWVASSERGKSSSASVASASTSAASVVGTPGSRSPQVVLVAARFDRFHGPSTDPRPRVPERKRTYVHTADSVDCRSHFLSIPPLFPYVSLFLFLLSLVSFSPSFIVSRLLSLSSPLASSTLLAYSF